MLHHLADHVPGVHLGILGGARQRVAVIPHPAAPRPVAYRRRNRSRVRPRVKPWALVDEKVTCLASFSDGDETFSECHSSE